MTANQPSSSPESELLTKQVAMLCQGSEVYGVGTIIKLYATTFPEMSFVASESGPLLDWLHERGHRVDLVPGLTRFREGGTSALVLLRVPRVLALARRDAARINEVLRGRGIRIIHAHWRVQQITAGYLRELGYRSVWQINNNMTPGRLLGLGQKLNHRMARWGADLLLPASDFIGTFWQASRVPMRTIRNAALPKFSAPNVLPETPVRCLVAGRLVHSKGHHLAVDAVIRARRAGLDVQLDVYGDPLDDNPYAAQLQQMIQNAGCRDAIRLLGFQRDLRLHHQEYHLGLQCRIDPEPCSLWVCETLVDGLPIVASDSGGTPELVEDGVTGLLFRSGDVDDLTEKLLQLARDPVRLREMRAHSFDRGRRQFTMSRMARETLDAYTSALH